MMTEEVIAFPCMALGNTLSVSKQAGKKKWYFQIINIFRDNYRFASIAKIFSIIHLLSNYLLSTYKAPNTGVPSAGDKMVDPRQGNIHSFTGEVHCLVEKTNTEWAIMISQCTRA